MLILRFSKKKILIAFFYKDDIQVIYFIVDYASNLNNDFRLNDKVHKFWLNQIRLADGLTIDPTSDFDSRD